MKINLEDPFFDRLELPGGIPLETVAVPAGTGWMGSPADEPERLPWENRHKITIRRGFRLGKYPVTQEQYRSLTGKNPSYFPGPGRPVETVDWQESIDFCRLLSERFHAELPTGCVFTLPTEAQWEYACRAGTDAALNSGEAMLPDPNALSDTLDRVGWYRRNSNDATRPAGLKAPNRWGLFDMHGNVREWCLDYSGEYSGDAEDPAGPVFSFYRIARGGDWISPAERCRSASRAVCHPEMRRNTVGFRVAIVRLG